MTFLRKLAKSIVFVVGAVYLIVAWLLAEVVAVHGPALIVGFPTALYLGQGLRDRSLSKVSSTPDRFETPATQTGFA